MRNLGTYKAKGKNWILIPECSESWIAHPFSEVKKLHRRFKSLKDLATYYGISALLMRRALEIVGVEYVSLDDRFNFSADDDTNFLGQVFAGFRFRTQGGLSAQLGARYLFRQDFDILGDEFIAEDTFGFEASIGFRF